MKTKPIIIQSLNGNVLSAMSHKVFDDFIEKHIFQEGNWTGKNTCFIWKDENGNWLKIPKGRRTYFLKDIYEIELIENLIKITFKNSLKIEGKFRFQIKNSFFDEELKNKLEKVKVREFTKKLEPEIKDLPEEVFQCFLVPTSKEMNLKELLIRLEHQMFFFINNINENENISKEIKDVYINIFKEYKKALDRKKGILRTIHSNILDLKRIEELIRRNPELIEGVDLSGLLSEIGETISSIEDLRLNLENNFAFTEEEIEFIISETLKINSVNIKTLFIEHIHISK